MIQLDGKQKDPPIDATESCRSDILDLRICVFVNHAGDNLVCQFRIFKIVAHGNQRN